MTARSEMYGYPMHWDGKCWRFDDTGEPTDEALKHRPCGHCGKMRTKEGYDGCLGKLPGGVMNACCGHGSVGVHQLAYIQYGADKNGHWLESGMVRGDAALAEFARLGVGPGKV